MAYDWNTEWETERFLQLWDKRIRSGVRHTSEAWDQRAHNWERELREDGKKQVRSERRIAETVSYLLSQGLLGSGDTVVDIGCGPGRFAVEFAHHAGHVTGVDLSPQMVEYGAAFAAECGVDNVDFTACDFKTADIAQMGWEGKFDLVFSSITPAVSGREGFEKMERMSRGWCFNSSFVHAADPVGQAAMEAVLPGVRLPAMWDGRPFYAMFNVLWLRGRFPRVRYYREQDVERLTVDRDLVRRVTERYHQEAITEAVTEGVYRWLMEHAGDDGAIDYPTERWYGWVLWDVRDRVDRDYGV